MKSIRETPKITVVVRKRPRSNKEL